MTEIEGKMPSTTGLTTTAALNAVQNQILKVTDRFKKPDYDIKIKNIKSKCFTTSDYNKFTDDILHKRIKNKQLINPIFPDF